MLHLGPALVELGHDDAEVDDDLEEYKFQVKDHEYGWDNEHPKRQVEVGEFRISWRPVTNGQFYKVFKANRDKFSVPPTSWIEEDGEVKVGLSVSASKLMLTIL